MQETEYDLDNVPIFYHGAKLGTAVKLKCIVEFSNVSLWIGDYSMPVETTLDYQFILDNGDILSFGGNKSLTAEYKFWELASITIYDSKKQSHIVKSVGFIVPEKHPRQKLLNQVPGLSAKAPCPVSDCVDASNDNVLYSLIQHINDDHKWTREQIADWLDTLSIDLTFKGENND